MDLQNFFGSFQLEEEENLRWLSYLPLFGEEHWPVNIGHGPITNYHATTDDYLMYCICGEYEHDIVCVFPYARYGHRSAWYVMEETMDALQEYYMEDHQVDYYHSERQIQSIGETITESWPQFFARIYHQSWDFQEGCWCRALWYGDWSDGCHDSPFRYPFWAPDEAEYIQCQCTGFVQEDLPSPQSGSEEESDDLDWGDIQFEWAPVPAWDFSPRPDVVVPGRYGEGRKSVVISEWYPWQYQITGESRESDNPPPYKTVSELPPYEHPPGYEDDATTSSNQKSKYKTTED